MTMGRGPRNSPLVPADRCHGTTGTPMGKPQPTATPGLEPAVSGYPLQQHRGDELLLGRSERFKTTKQETTSWGSGPAEAKARKTAPRRHGTATVPATSETTGSHCCLFLSSRLAHNSHRDCRGSRAIEEGVGVNTLRAAYHQGHATPPSRTHRAQTVPVTSD